VKRLKVIHLKEQKDIGDPEKIRRRLRDFLFDCRIDKLARAAHGKRFSEVSTVANGDEIARLEHEALLKRVDEERIRARVEKLFSRRAAASGTSHLSKAEIARLQAAWGDIPVAVAKSEAWADEVAAKLHQESPWLASATEVLWHSLRRSARLGAPIKISPLIINGPPGVGKTRLAKRFAELVSVPSVALDASTGSPGFSIVGLERGWGSAQPGRPVEMILEGRIANGIVVVDEICKAKSAESKKGTAFSFYDALLSLLEPESARRWECPFFRVSFDMSHLSWIFTSNDVDLVQPTVKSRCAVVNVRALTPLELQDFAIRRGREMSLSDPSIEAIIVALMHASDRLERHLSLRDVSRMLARAQDLESRPIFQ
jgi:hypothetical protein